MTIETEIPAHIDLKSVRPRTGEAILQILEERPEARTWTNKRFGTELQRTQTTIKGGIRYLELMGLVQRFYGRPSPGQPAGRMLVVTK